MTECIAVSKCRKNENKSVKRRGNGRGGVPVGKKWRKMRISHRGRRQRAAAQSLRKINLSVSVSLSLHLPPPRLPLPPSCSLARSSLFLESPLGVPLQPGSSGTPFWLGQPRSLPLGSHLHYEREDLLAAEYNADLSVSIHRDREPSSSRVPLRRGYTYPPSAARRGTEKTKRGGRNRGKENGTGLSRSILRLVE